MHVHFAHLHGGYSSGNAWNVRHYRTGSGESIQSAIDRAKPGDTVDVPGGTYQENIYVDKQLKLRGRNDRGKPTVIAAQSKGEAIFLDANGCSIEGFEIRNGEG